MSAIGRPDSGIGPVSGYFQGGNVPEDKQSVHFSMVFRHPERTLTGEEVDRTHQVAWWMPANPSGARLRELIRIGSSEDVQGKRPWRMNPIRQWRSWVLALLLIGPVLIYVGLGMIWLWQRGWIVLTVADDLLDSGGPRLLDAGRPVDQVVATR